MSVFAIGDIHGNIKSLKECLTFSSFDYENDFLYILGDVCDGFFSTRTCVDELLKINHRVVIRGNHDEWFMNWFTHGVELPVWTSQGGLATLGSYGFKRENVPQSHKEFFNNSVYYYVDDQRRLFVHGGYRAYIGKTAETEEPFHLMWDRQLIEYAREHPIKDYTHVFVGHTTTQLYKYYVPLKANNLTMLDTGGGWNGRLTIMNVDTFEYWQSKKRHQRSQKYETYEVTE